MLFLDCDVIFYQVHINFVGYFFQASYFFNFVEKILLNCTSIIRRFLKKVDCNLTRLIFARISGFERVVVVTYCFLRILSLYFMLSLLQNAFVRRKTIFFNHYQIFIVVNHECLVCAKFIQTSTSFFPCFVDLLQRILIFSCIDFGYFIMSCLIFVMFMSQLEI